MKGAAEYENLIEEKYHVGGRQRAMEGMGAQSVGHLLIMAFVIMGNIGYFVRQEEVVMRHCGTSPGPASSCPRHPLRVGPRLSDPGPGSAFLTLRVLLPLPGEPLLPVRRAPGGGVANGYSISFTVHRVLVPYVFKPLGAGRQDRRPPTGSR